MFSFILVSLAILSSVSALTLPRHHLALPRRHLIVPRAQPQGYATGYLEPYDQYHTRYMALDCEGKHNTSFFDDCCHPLLATEKLETARPAKCIPSSSTPTPTTTSIAPNPTNDGECVDDSSSSTTPTTQPEPPKDTPTPTPQPVKDTPTPQPVKDTPTPQPVKETPKPQPDTTTPPTTHSSSPSVPAVPAPGGSQTGGHATFFYQNGVAGACGTVHGDNDLVAAMDYRRYGALDVKSILCGRQVRLTNTDNGKSVTVTVADACPTCDNRNSIDLSVAAFQRIASLNAGYVPIDWAFV